jgi:hypothetical protein
VKSRFFAKYAGRTDQAGLGLKYICNKPCGGPARFGEWPYTTEHYGEQIIGHKVLAWITLDAPTQTSR